MKDNLFDTSDKIKSNLAILDSGRNSAFWKLMRDILDANIEVLKEHILRGSENDTIESVVQLRDRLKTLQDVRDTPENMIKSFEKGDLAVPNFDPYMTAEDVRIERNKRVDKAV